MSDLTWHVRDRVLSLRRPLVMGVVNVTPDSFSDGGRLSSPTDAVAHALQLIDDGADVVDVGGESTRPGAGPVPVDEELRRVVPVVEGLAQRLPPHVVVSVDTYKGEVARRCLAAGAHIINDVTALGDPAMAAAVRNARAGLVLMHMLGDPQTMQRDPRYDDVVSDVVAGLGERLKLARQHGIAEQAVALDPGIGFGKTDAHNLALLRDLGRLRGLGRPVCLGVSRKGFLGRLLGRDADERLAGSLAVVCFALGPPGATRTADILRVHDVAATRDAVRVFEALGREERG